MNVSELIDQFVVIIDPAGALFRKIESAPWIDTMELKFPKRLPTSFRSLVTRYAFPAVTVGGLDLFANQGLESDDELSVAIFRDQFSTDPTLKAGYIQFARPQGGSY